MFFVVVVQSLSCGQLFETPWIAARQASLFFTISRRLHKLMSIEWVMLFNHLILYALLDFKWAVHPIVQFMGLESLKTESIHFIKGAKLLVEQICPVTILSFFHLYVWCFRWGQKCKTIVAATEVSWSLVMDWGPVRLLGMILLWWGDITCALDPTCYQEALGLWGPQYSHFGPAECTGLWQARRRVYTSELSSFLETETLDFLSEFSVSYTFNIFLTNILVSYNWIRN